MASSLAGYNAELSMAGGESRLGRLAEWYANMEISESQTAALIKKWWVLCDIVRP